MAGLPQKSFQQFTDDQVAAWAASLGFQPTLQKGDALYAAMQAVSSQLVFIQALVYLINNVARASTCGSDLNNGTTDADLDSFYAPFSFTRLPAKTATGAVTFSAPAPVASQIIIAVGTIVQTPGGAIVYQVVADPTQLNWSPILGAYLMPAGQQQLTATVQAALAGAAYNVTVGQLSQIASSLPGITTVTNANAINNGINAEANPAYRARFVNYLNSLAKATYGAIVSAIQGVQQGLDFSLQENVDVAGHPHPGEFVATIDDGSGNPPATLITAIINAVEAVRGFTILAEVQAASIVTVTIAMAVRVAAGFTASTVQANVKAAVAAAVNAAQVGQTLFVAANVEVAALAVAGVVSVQPGTTINGLAADFAVTGFQRVGTNPGAVAVGTY